MAWYTPPRRQRHDLVRKRKSRKIQVKSRRVRLLQMQEARGILRPVGNDMVSLERADRLKGNTSVESAVNREPARFFVAVHLTN